MAREGLIQIRVSGPEKAQIEQNAQRAGAQSPAAYLRALGLDAQTSPGRPVSGAKAAAEEATAPAVAAGSIPGPGETSVAAVAERTAIEDEVREAKMVDDAAHREYVRRRARQLVGQGKTTVNAARLAEQEWENR